MDAQLLMDTITIKQAGLAETLRIAAGVGYDGVELRGNDLTEWSTAGNSLEELADLLADLGLVAPTLCTESDVYHWHHGRPMDDSSFLVALERYLQSCQRLGCSEIFVPVLDTKGTLDETVENFGWLCDQAAGFDVVVALEFIGHIPKVADVQTAAKVLESANRPNSGLVVDVFHFYRGGSEIEDLRRLPMDKISVVHLDDAMSLPLDELIGSRHRLYPGEGVAPVREMIAVLQESGYQGPYCVELFNEDYWAADPWIVARHAREATLKLFDQKGLP